MWRIKQWFQRQNAGETFIRKVYHLVSQVKLWNMSVHTLCGQTRIPSTQDHSLGVTWWSHVEGRGFLLGGWIWPRSSDENPRLLALSHRAALEGWGGGNCRGWVGILADTENKNSVGRLKCRIRFLSSESQSFSEALAVAVKGSNYPKPFSSSLLFQLRHAKNKNGTF